MRLFDAIGRKAGTDKGKQSPQDSNVWRQITSSICFINAMRYFAKEATRRGIKLTKNRNLLLQRQI